MSIRQPPVDPEHLYDPSDFYSTSRSVNKNIGDDFDEDMWRSRGITPKSSSEESRKKAEDLEAFFRDLGEG